MEWTTLTMQVTTPLFNGGADPDGKAGFRPAGDAGVRLASIRGAMRFWFRALAGSMAGSDLESLAGRNAPCSGVSPTSEVTTVLPCPPR